MTLSEKSYVLPEKASRKVRYASKDRILKEIILNYGTMREVRESERITEEIWVRNQ